MDVDGKFDDDEANAKITPIIYNYGFVGGGHPELSTCEGCFPEGFKP